MENNVLDKFIENTSTKFVRVSLSPSKNLPPMVSKVLGVPYWEGDATPPKDMYLLAQINLSEVPKLKGYPESGILQFFISNKVGIIGLTFGETDEPAYAVVFWPTPSADKCIKVDVPQPEEDSTPTTVESAMSFSVEEESLGPCDDYSLSKYLSKVTPPVSEEDVSDVTDMLFEVEDERLNNAGNKICGYATFTQSDPRERDAFTDPWVLLFQLDTDDDAGVMWGDVGVGNWFIRESDLAKRDFSKVLFNWDCC